MRSVNLKRISIWGLTGVLGVALLVWAMLPQPILVEVEAVGRGPLQVSLGHEGKTRMREPFLISSPVSGRVQRVHLEPGDPVTRGETVLAVIEPSSPDPLDARDRAEASAAVAAARSRLAQARAELDRSRSRHRLAQADRDRIERLAADQVVGARELQSAETEARAAFESVRMAEAASQAAHFELERVQARLTTSGDQPLEDARLEVRSPVDGVVLRRFHQSALVVPKGEPLLELGDPEGLEVVADFLSADAARVRPGMAAVISRWGGQEDLEGRVRRVDPAGYTKISALGVEEQRVDVVVDLLAPRSTWNALGEGFRVEVAVVVWEGDDLLTVPASSLVRDRGAWSVFRLEGSRARLSPVEIGQTDGRRSEILSGLEVGDRVVTHPPEALADSSRVEIRDSNE